MNNLEVYKRLHKYALLIAPGKSFELLLFLIVKFSNIDGKVIINDSLLNEYNLNLPEELRITERTFFRSVKVLLLTKALIKESRGVYKITSDILIGDLIIPLTTLSYSLEQDKGMFEEFEIRDKTIFEKAEELQAEVFENIIKIEDMIDKHKRQRPNIVMFEEIGDWPGVEIYGEANIEEAKEFIKDKRIVDEITTHTEVMTKEEAKELYPQHTEEINMIDFTKMEQLSIDIPKNQKDFIDFTDKIKHATNTFIKMDKIMDCSVDTTEYQGEPNIQQAEKDVLNNLPGKMKIHSDPRSPFKFPELPKKQESSQGNFENRLDLNGAGSKLKI